MRRLLVIAIFVLAAAPAAEAFHDLDCGPFRAQLVDDETGERRCAPMSPEAQAQVLRFRELQREQEKRVRDLLLQQRQREKRQELIATKELVKQRQFNRRQAVRQQQPVLALEQAITREAGRLREEPLDKVRKDLLLENELERQRNLLEQQLSLPLADLEDEQKALVRKLEKDQQGQ